VFLCLRKDTLLEKCVVFDIDRTSKIQSSLKSSVLQKLLYL
jgi:hypothetical protein